MGRKGVAKRKPPQLKVNPSSKDNASGVISSIKNEIKGQLVKPPGMDKTVILANRGGVIHSSNSRKNSKKR